MNAVRTLLEDHDYIVQEIDGGNDHGEDLHVLLTRGGNRTGHVLAIQVKAGRKYKRAKGYTIPVEDHFDDWRKSKIPVVGVVFDVDTRKLYWVNLTAELWKAQDAIKRVTVPRSSVLTSETMPDFVGAIEAYMDSTGTKLRDFTLEEAFIAVSRALDGLDPNNVPNPLFEGWAELLFRHEAQARRIARLLLQVCPLLLLASLLAFEWPYQVRFVANYTDLNPVLTVGSLYILISWMALTIFFELRAGRRPKETGNWLINICGLYLWIPVMDNGGGPKWIGGSLVAASVIISHFGLLTLLMFYILRELDRKKSRCK
ncbi:DUF4365 domain-containing protein [Streptomyces sp. B15]|uniref:DUF4365 domain-containing protein n=1 Tax=Streptomyces sp. B15 TaxID=1537797 RepID=UPI001B3860B9|nr:DUF4365 domain-containing protein [Streptomyces sp. B15]MBQ1124634.1 DUF4365 domain-containing protein [Streptomyces sp. B15]